MSGLALTPRRQLAVVKYEHNPYFSHALICSTAPTNAEDQIRNDLIEEKRDLLLDDRTEEYLDALKQDLRTFINKELARGNRDFASKLNVVFNIHGYNVPFKNFLKGFASTQAMFASDTEKAPPDDYVLFIDYCWPSEAMLVSQLSHWLTAMPYPLLLIVGIAIASLVYGGLWLGLGLVLLGFAAALIVLRLIVYFRDRERAANHGVYDAVELVRWLHVMVQEQISANGDPHDESIKGRISISFLAHSMGCFVATQTIRILSDVFDDHAVQRWKDLSPYGPFADLNRCVPKPSQPGGTKEQQNLSLIGDHFTLKRLVLVSPDIPVWAVTSGRSNYLKASLRRFEEAFLFVNDADIVLRLASTLANYFVFPSSTRQGGYRLGNLSITIPVQAEPYGELEGNMASLILKRFRSSIPLTESPFFCTELVGSSLNVVDCTDYRDTRVGGTETARMSRRLSARRSKNGLSRLANYALTALLQPFGLGGIDSHGGYFQGTFCLNLFYCLLLFGKEGTRQRYGPWAEVLKQYQLVWLTLKD
jgi:hypothetical protein